MTTRTEHAGRSAVAALAGLLLLCIGSPATAATADTQEAGTVDWVLPRSGVSSQIILFQLSGTVEGPRPQCVIDGSQGVQLEMWAIPDPTSGVGRAQFALLLAAQLAGATVEVKGRDTCAEFNGIEDVYQMRIVND
jgi:hypothetical protein